MSKRASWFPLIWVRLSASEPSMRQSSTTSMLTNASSSRWRTKSIPNEPQGDALLYALAHVPTLFTLADPSAGKNPLLVLAALGGGLCWSFLVERTGRLLPSLLAHAVFSYFAARSLWLLG